MDFSKIRWNRHFGTNDLCEIAIFQVIKVYFWGGMAERAELANGQLNFVFSSAALAEKSQVNMHFARWREL